jgi:hypothetical protein
MSRSGYTDESDGNAIYLWRANIDRATRGKRGQKFFRDLVAALDAMPEKRLINGDLEGTGGSVCALGALRVAKGLELTPALRDSDWDSLGEAFDVAPMLAQEVMYWNDERVWRNDETPEARWQRMRDWAAEQVLP